MDKNRYQVQFEKDKSFLKAFLVGRNFHVALRALGWIERATEGKFRKCGKMPEMHHMVRLSLNAIQLGLSSLTLQPNSLSLEEQLITTLLYHDAIEDDETCELEVKMISMMSNTEIGKSTWLMTKKFRGQVKDKQEYITEIGRDLLAALGKGIDRNDNLEHMIGTFTLQKIISYTREAKTEHYPMLKKASHLFPEYLREFQIVMYRMKSNIKMLEQYSEVATALEMATTVNEQLARATEQTTELKPVKTDITSIQVVQRVLHVFGDISPHHRSILQGKLCTEFGVSHFEF